MRLSQIFASSISESLRALQSKPNSTIPSLKCIQKPLSPCGKRGKCNLHLYLRDELVQLGEVLDGANHLRGVGVLVVVPGHDLTGH